MGIYATMTIPVFALIVLAAVIAALTVYLLVTVFDNLELRKRVADLKQWSDHTSDMLIATADRAAMHRKEVMRYERWFGQGLRKGMLSKQQCQKAMAGQEAPRE